MSDPIEQVGERARATASRNLNIYAITDATCDELERLFWSLVPVVAEQACVTEPDAIFHLRRAWLDKLKAVKLAHGVDYRDDGRTAAWRVRLMIWRQGPQGQSDLHGDSDPGARFDQYHVAPGSTIVYGLPAVAEWVAELCTAAHPAGSVFDGLSLETLQHKIRSLRVSLSNSGGRSTWRIRYGVTPPAAPADESRPVNPLRVAAGSGPTEQRFMATVDVQREESPRHKGA